MDGISTGIPTWIQYRQLEAPMFSAAERGSDDEHHEGKLKVHVDHDDAREGVEVEADAGEADAKGVKPGGENSRGAESRDEHEGQIHATEVRKHARGGGGQSLEHRALGCLDGVGHEDAKDAGNQ
jgi:hypothetical protein